MLEGLDTTTLIFFWGFVIGAALTLLYVLFSDILDGLFDVGDSPFLNPTIILSFIAIFCGSGFIFEFKTDLSIWIVSLLSLAIAIIIVSLLHIFILAPVKKAEQSTAYSMNDLVGKIGVITVSIPENELGQISLNEKMGYQSHPAKSRDGSAIKTDTEVRIVRMEDGICVVKEYNGSLNKKED